MQAHLALPPQQQQRAARLPRLRLPATPPRLPLPPRPTALLRLRLPQAPPPPLLLHLAPRLRPQQRPAIRLPRLPQLAVPQPPPLPPPRLPSLRLAAARLLLPLLALPLPRLSPPALQLQLPPPLVRCVPHAVLNTGLKPQLDACLMEGQLRHTSSSFHAFRLT